MPTILVNRGLRVALEITSVVWGQWARDVDITSRSLLQVQGGLYDKADLIARWIDKRAGGVVQVVGLDLNYDTTGWTLYTLSMSARAE